MGRFLEKFKKGTKKAGEGVEKINNSDRLKPKEQMDSRRFHKQKSHETDAYGTGEDEEIIDDYDEFKEDNYNDEVGVQQAQKPESFHHFILENQYRDLEEDIRGYKQVYQKETRDWKTKRKDKHCFTDEEAEDILRTAQSHLATDIKLGFIKKEVFGDYMNALYKQLANLFFSIAEYRYGRYNSFDKNGNLEKVNYDTQFEMKLQNKKIFLDLFTRIQANYSRSIQGQENKYTHESVKGQESLQGTDRDFSRNRSYN